MKSLSLVWHLNCLEEFIDLKLAILSVRKSTPRVISSTQFTTSALESLILFFSSNWLYNNVDHDTTALSLLNLATLLCVSITCISTPMLEDNDFVGVLWEEVSSSHSSQTITIRISQAYFLSVDFFKNRYYQGIKGTRTMVGSLPIDLEWTGTYVKDRM